VFAFTFAFVQPVVGAAADLFGKARLMIICMAVLGVANVLGALASLLFMDWGFYMIHAYMRVFASELSVEAVPPQAGRLGRSATQRCCTAQAPPQLVAGTTITLAIMPPSSCSRMWQW